MLSILANNKMMFVAALLCIAFVVQRMQLKAERADKAVLEERIIGYQKTVMAGNAEIAALSKELNDMGLVLVERAKKNNQVKQQLQNDIDQLQQALEGIDCLGQPWPSSVSDKLRQDY